MTHHLWYSPAASRSEAKSFAIRTPILRVVFFRTSAGLEPVRSWLQSLTREARKAIGEDIKTAQFGWPLGMPLIRKLEPNLWEVRSRIPEGIARVVFSVGEGNMVLLHAFIKKSQRTPLDELKTARQRLAILKETTP
jgi:phage-related protein